MNQQYLVRNVEHLLFQRNLLVAITLLVSVALVVASCFLFVKRERIVVVPAVVDKAFWVEESQVSATYLEQFGVFLGQLLLNKSHQSASKQREILLRHTTADFRSALSVKLADEEQLLKKQNASYVFYPVSVEVNSNTRSVQLEGDRAFFIGGKQVSSQRESYILRFSCLGGRVFLKGVESVERKDS